MSRSNHAKKRMQYIKNVVVLALFSCAITHSVFAQLSDAQYAEKLTHQTSEQLKQVALKFDTQHLDYAQFVESLEFDIYKVINFVTNDIHYAPYLGSMRAQQGTLAARSGSAWDQAILLASMIHASGGEARLVKGTLANADAKRLIQLAHSTKTTPYLSELNAKLIEQSVSRLKTTQQKIASPISASSGASIRPISQASLNAATQETAQKLRSFLKKQGIEIASSSNLNTVANAIAQDYVWLEYRAIPSDPWRELHPTFAKKQSPKVNPTQYFTGSVPDAYVHQIEVTLSIEKKDGTDFYEEPIILPLRLPVSEWQYGHHSISIAPGNLLRSTTDEAAFFIPQINGEIPTGAKGFTLSGRSFDAKQALSGPSLFTTLADKMSDAIARDNDMAFLTGITLSIKHIAPNNITRTEKRRIVDFREHTPSLKTPHILNQILLNVSTGHAAQDAEIKEIFSNYAKQFKTIPIYADYLNRVSNNATTATKLTNSKTNTHIWNEFIFASPLFNNAVSEDQLVFRSGPLIATKRLQINEQGTRGAIMDITHHDLVGFSLNKEQTLMMSPAAVFTHGIKETLAEQYLMTQSLSHGYLGEHYTLLNDDAAISSWGRNNKLGQLTLERMRSDLTHSGLIVAIKNSNPVKWWRINPNSGEILGMSTAGGSETSEYAMLTKHINYAIGMAYAAYGAQSCATSYPNNRAMQACCHAGNIALSALGGAVGKHLSLATVAPMYSSLGTLVIDVGFEISVNTVAGTAGNTFNGVCETTLQPSGN